MLSLYKIKISDKLVATDNLINLSLNIQLQYWKRNYYIIVKYATLLRCINDYNKKQLKYQSGFVCDQ